MKAVKQGLTWICQEHASVKASNWIACVMFAAIDLLTLNHSKAYHNVLVLSSVMFPLRTYGKLIISGQCGSKLKPSDQINILLSRCKRNGHNSFNL